MRKHIALGWLCWLVAGLAGAETLLSAQIHWLKDVNRVEVAVDASYTQETEIEYRALNEQGARQFGQWVLGYNRALEQLEILSAETIKADGRRVPVPDSARIKQSGAMGVLNFKDIELVKLAFADLAPGDTVHVHYRKRAQPLFPGFFSWGASLNELFLRDRVEVSLTLPAGMALQRAQQGFALEEEQVRDGRRQLRWQHRVSKLKADEANQTDAAQQQPHLWLSTFPDWAALGQAYRARHAPQVEVTPEIRALAQQLTAGVSEPREQARRLYDWVRSQIRYNATYGGMEGWVPQPAATVLANRLGDCKGHVVLLEALLRAVGIDSEPVLLRADTVSYRLPPLPMPGFNHVINYLPQLDLYLDATAKMVEFGRLPYGDQGKPVLRAGAAPSLAVTPAAGVAERRIQRRSVIRVAADGRARLETTLRYAEDFRHWYEAFRQGVGQGKEDVWARQQLRAAKWRGTARLRYLAEEAGWVGLQLNHTLENYLPEGEVGQLDFAFLPYGGPTSPVGNVTSFFAGSSRRTPFQCAPIEFDDRVEIHLPDTLQLLHLPTAQTVEADGVSLQQRFSEQDGAYVMQRTVRWTPPNFGSCTAAEWKAWRDPMQQIGRALRGAKLSYQRRS